MPKFRVYVEFYDFEEIEVIARGKQDALNKALRKAADMYMGDPSADLENVIEIKDNEEPE